MAILGKAGRWFGAIVSASNLLASLWILGLMGLVVADVAARFLFNSPIAGVNEMMEISIVAMLYMQVTQALRDDRHTRSPAFLSMVMTRKPRAGHLLRVLFSAAGLALMVAIVAGAAPRVIAAYRGGYTIGTRGVFLVPEWPVLLIIAGGCTLMAVQFAIDVAASWRAHRAAGRGRASSPV